MRITVLVEDTSLSSEFKLTHGICLYIETTKHKILFDLGSDNLFLKTAKLLNIDISTVDIVVISQCEIDRSEALVHFLNNNDIAKVYIPNHITDIELKEVLNCKDRIVYNPNIFEIDKELLLFKDAIFNNDYKDLENNHNELKHEQRLIVREGSNSVLFGGCANQGVIEIQECASNLIGNEVTHVVSGIHLNTSLFNRQQTMDDAKNLAHELVKMPTKYYTCHCTGKKQFDVIQEIMDDKIDYISTGTMFEI